MQRYSAQFRNTILQKMIGPEKRTAPDLSEEYGVSGSVKYLSQIDLASSDDFRFYEALSSFE